MKRVSETLCVSYAEERKKRKKGERKERKRKRKRKRKRNIYLGVLGFDVCELSIVF